jgi:hypothetical protein
MIVTMIDSLRHIRDITAVWCESEQIKPLRNETPLQVPGSRAVFWCGGEMLRLNSVPLARNFSLLFDIRGNSRNAFDTLVKCLGSSSTSLLTGVRRRCYFWLT